MQYVGSKRRISKEIVPIIQSYITEDTTAYIEPFVGGANVIDKIQCKKKIGCDVHKQLIALLEQAQKDISVFPDTITEEEYNTVKNNKEGFPDWYQGLVGFTATFGNKYFGGFARGKGGARDRPKEAINNIKKQSKNLKNINFYNINFLEIDPLLIKGCVVYCDIPYKNTTKYNAVNGFNHDKFYDWCKNMKNGG